MPDAAPMPELEFRRKPDCVSTYANNVQFESSVWDLKLIFGNIDQSRIPHAIDQHTIVNIPWQQARLLAYYLAVNTTVYEATNGKIPFPSRVIPQRPDPTDPSLDELGKRVVTYLAWVHEQFFGPNPYIPPGVSDLFGQQTPPPTTAEESA